MHHGRIPNKLEIIIHHCVDQWSNFYFSLMSSLNFHKCSIQNKIFMHIKHKKAQKRKEVTVSDVWSISSFVTHFLFWRILSWYNAHHNFGLPLLKFTFTSNTRMMLWFRRNWQNLGKLEHGCWFRRCCRS